MRVAILARAVYPLHGIGGLERHVGALIRHLVRGGLEVSLYTPPAKHDFERIEAARIRFVPYRLLPWPRRPGFVVADRITNYIGWSLRAARSLLADTADVVQAEAGAGFGYAFLRPPGSAPLVLHPHGMEEFKAAWIKRSAYLPLRSAVRYASRRAERVVVPDRAMVEEVCRYLSVGPRRAVVLPNAVDLEEIDRLVPAQVRQEITSRLGIEPATTVLLSVGRLEANKGFEGLADALGRIKDDLSQGWLWVLVGQGSRESRIRERVERSGLGEQVRFAGSVKDEELSALYQRATLFVHPSLYEGSSLVTLEAMAHRKAVVASAVGGITDKIEEGKTGLLVPPGDAEALARAIRQALSLGDRLAEWGEQGRRRVEAEFSWAERARKLVDLYREVIAESR